MTAIAFKSSRLILVINFMLIIIHEYNVNERKLNVFCVYCFDIGLIYKVHTKVFDIELMNDPC